MTKIRVSDQVEAFVKALAPDPKKILRAGINALAEGAGDIKYLEADLLGWQRLRVQNFRVVFTATFVAGTRFVDCVYVNRRAVVYELFKELLRNQLLQSEIPPAGARAVHPVKPGIKPEVRPGNVGKKITPLKKR